jgi:hypothetical protein
MWTVAVLLTGVQATAMQDGSANWLESTAAAQGGRNTIRPADGPEQAIENQPPPFRLDALESQNPIPGTLHFEALYRWHRDATQLP